MNPSAEVEDLTPTDFFDAVVPDPRQMDHAEIDSLILAIKRIRNIERGRGVLLGAVCGFATALCFFGLLAVLT